MTRFSYRKTAILAFFAFICAFLYLGLVRNDELLPSLPAKRDWNCTTAAKGSDLRKKVAIVGAGSAGASTAYYLREFGGDCYDISIDVLERNDYIGGRSTTVNVFGDASLPVELGASIFVEVNHNLVSAAEKFGLIKGSAGGGSRSSSTGSDDEEGDSDRFGVWDGQSFVFTMPANESYWRTVMRMLWKYGLSPLRTQRLMKATVGKFLQLYGAPYFPFASLTDAAGAVGLTEVTSQRGSAFLEANGIAPPFSTDLIQASTRVNYAQNLDQIHGLETMVCMATDGAMAVKGGNWRIFENMLVAARAAAHLNTSVTSIAKNSGGAGGYNITVADMSDDTRQITAQFDEVVIAAPYQFADIALSADIKHVPEKIDYVTLHVTLFTSPHTLQPQYFNCSSAAEVPSTVLTTLPNNTVSANSSSPVKDFFSISTLDTVFNPATLRDEYLYKIFSPQPVSASLLQHLFLGDAVVTSSPQHAGDGEIEKDDGVTTWKYEKVWHSYPYLPPRATFEDPVLDDGLYYTAGIESFISTMETSSLMGMNVAALIVERWQEQDKKQAQKSDGNGIDEEEL